jgi:hypothetical protein
MAKELDPRFCDRPDSGAEKWMPDPPPPDDLIDLTGMSPSDLLDWIQTQLAQDGVRSVEIILEQRGSRRRLKGLSWRGTSV